MNSRDHEPFEHLMMKAVDGMLTAEESEAFQQHLEVCASCREEFEDFCVIKEDTDMLRRRIVASARVEGPTEATTSRTTVVVGTALFLSALLLFLGYGAHALFTDAQVPIGIKIGAGLSSLACLVFLLYVVKVRVRAEKHDPYKEIDQ